MRVLIVGGGGREHALAWKLSQSDKVSKLYCAPGNGGIAELAERVHIGVLDIDKMVAFAKEHVDLVVVAPDDPLAAGMVDAMQDAGVRAFGPNKAAARIEASKSFSKDLMRKYGIPTAKYAVFDDPFRADRYLDESRYPIVVKADGLALGKGVIICEDAAEAHKAVDEIMRKRVFGAAGASVVIEEFMTGPEVSILAFTDGKTIVPMVSAQDHKRAFDGDQGPNTGGMGTFAPSPKYTGEVAKFVEESVMLPTIEAMRAEGCPFKGVLYVGLMLTPQGPKVLEYNARFGDPETQVVLPLLKSDLIDIFEAIIDERLDEVEIEWSDKTAVCVVLASGGYPGEYAKGKEISGLDKLGDAVAFHAGTERTENGALITSGGRVLGITALGDFIPMAREEAYKAVGLVSFEGMQFRSDIGIK